MSRTMMSSMIFFLAFYTHKTISAYHVRWKYILLLQPAWMSSTRLYCTRLHITSSLVLKIWRHIFSKVLI